MLIATSYRDATGEGSVRLIARQALENKCLIREHSSVPRRFDSISGLNAGDRIQPDNPADQNRSGIFRKDGEFWTVGYTDGRSISRTPKGSPISSNCYATQTWSSTCWS